MYVEIKQLLCQEIYTSALISTICIFIPAAPKPGLEVVADIIGQIRIAGIGAGDEAVEGHFEAVVGLGHFRIFVFDGAGGGGDPAQFFADEFDLPVHAVVAGFLLGPEQLQAFDVLPLGMPVRERDSMECVFGDGFQLPGRAVVFEDAESDFDHCE